jgi:hypothetical protein
MYISSYIVMGGQYRSSYNWWLQGEKARGTHEMLHLPLFKTRQTWGISCVAFWLFLPRSGYVRFSPEASYYRRRPKMSCSSRGYILFPDLPKVMPASGQKASSSISNAPLWYITTGKDFSLLFVDVDRVIHMASKQQ